MVPLLLVLEEEEGDGMGATAHGAGAPAHGAGAPAHGAGAPAHSVLVTHLYGALFTQAHSAETFLTILTRGAKRAGMY